MIMLIMKFKTALVHVLTMAVRKAVGIGYVLVHIEPCLSGIFMFSMHTQHLLIARSETHSLGPGIPQNSRVCIP